MKEKPGKDRFWGGLCAIGIIALAFLMNFHTVGNNDMFWHLKAGQIIFETHQVPHQDLFSFTVPGREWIDAQWLFQLVIYLLYRVSGFAGVIIMASLLSALTWFLILAPALNPRKYFSLSLLALVSLQAASARFIHRPELLTCFFLALELFLIHKYRRGKKTALYFLPALLLFWVNSHGLWPLYFVILGAFLAEEIVAVLNLRIPGMAQRSSPVPARASAIRITLILLGSLSVTLLNPYGLRGALFPISLFTEISSANAASLSITDLQSPLSSDFPWFERLPFIALLVFSTLIVLLLLRKRRANLTALLLWTSFLYLALTAERNTALLAMIVAGPLAGALAEANDNGIFPLPALSRRLKGLRPLGAGLVLLAMALIGADLVTSRFYVQNRAFTRFGIGALESDYPIRAAETLKAVAAASGAPAPLKIFSDFNSGYLIWAGYPEWKVYFDPRLELYGEEMIRNYFRASTDWRFFEEQDRKYDFDAVVITPEQFVKNLIVHLYRDPGWALVHLDGFSVVFVKDKPALRPGIGQYRIDFREGFASRLPAGLSGPGLARERRTRGMVIFALGAPEAALAELKAGLVLDPENISMNYYAGLALSMMRRYQEAIPYLDRWRRGIPRTSRTGTSRPGLILRPAGPGMPLQSTGRFWKSIRKKSPLA